MPNSHVAIVELDESTLEGLLAAAVDGAQPSDVMDPLPGERGWTLGQREAFRAFHRARSVATATPVERTFVVLVGGRPAGAGRLEPGIEGIEIGLWLGRRWRGRGVGTAAVRLLTELAGDSPVVAQTTSGNEAAVRLLRGVGADLSSAADDVQARLRPGRSVDHDAPGRSNGGQRTRRR